jgi:hypothetical protein
MTKDQVKEILDRVLTWPRERQEDAAELLLLIEEHDGSPHQLTDEQAAEIRLRMSDGSAAILTLAELDARLHRLGV